MIEFSDFQKTFLKEVYSRKPVSQHLIETSYQLFKTAVEQVNTQVRDSFKQNNVDFDDFLQTEYYSEVLDEALNRFIYDEFSEKKLTKDGFCLKSSILNRACCLIHNDSILGVIRGFDEKNPRFLMVDFGEVEDRKIDIDELIIAGIG